MTNAERLGFELFILRHRARVSQHVLAFLVGVSRAYISRIENRHTRPDRTLELAMRHAIYLAYQQQHGEQP